MFGLDRNHIQGYRRDCISSRNPLFLHHSFRNLNVQKTPLVLPHSRPKSLIHIWISTHESTCVGFCGKDTRDQDRSSVSCIPCATGLWFDYILEVFILINMRPVVRFPPEMACCVYFLKMQEQDDIQSLGIDERRRDFHKLIIRDSRCCDGTCRTSNHSTSNTLCQRYITPLFTWRKILPDNFSRKHTLPRVNGFWTSLLRANQHFLDFRCPRQTIFDAPNMSHLKRYCSSSDCSSSKIQQTSLKLSHVKHIPPIITFPISLLCWVLTIPFTQWQQNLSSL